MRIRFNWLMIGSDWWLFCTWYKTFGLHKKNGVFLDQFSNCYLSRRDCFKESASVKAATV
jgi:hypothetical protein